MIKDFSNNLEGFIRLVLLLFSFNCFSQVLPSTIGVHHKKETSFPEQSITLEFDGTNDRVDNTGVTLNNLIGFTLELWINADHAGSNIGIIGDRIFALETSLLGSVGALIRSADISELLAKVGVKPEIYKSGEFKSLPSPTEKTSVEGIIAPGVLTILSAILCYGLADKIYS